jgi:hypothetical protein
VSQPGGNDDIVKVVYQAVADYSQLLRETRRAQEETRRLKADIDALAGTTTATVRVTADTAAAKAELARVLRDVVVTVKVTVDAAAAKAEIARVVRDTVIRARLLVDTVAASAEIRRATQGAQAKVKVEADLTRFRTQLDSALRRTTVKVALELDRAGVITKMRSLITYLQQMGPVKLKVDVDKSVFARLEESAQQLRELRDSLRAPGGGGGPPGGPPTPTPTPSPRAPRPRGGGGGGERDNNVPDGLDAASGALLKFLPLIGAVIPLSAAAVGAVGAVGATLLAAGTSAGIFAVAAVGAPAQVNAAGHLRRRRRPGQPRAEPVRARLRRVPHLRRP